MSEELRLQRSQIHDFVGDDPDAVRVIEKLLKGYNTLINTSLVYDPLKTYSAGQYVSEDSVIYESQVSSNTGNLPSTSPTEWRILMETGSNSNGSYIVFSSGIQVCWFRATSGTTNLPNTGAGTGSYVWTFPKSFGSEANVQVSPTSTNTTNPVMTWGITGASLLTNAAGSIVLINASTVSMSALDREIRLFAIGESG